MADWKHAAAVAERQHLLITTWQLRLLGVSSGALSDRIALHGWRRRHRGVIALPGPNTPIRQVAAAVLAYSRPAGAAQRVHALEVEGVPIADALVRAALRCGQVVCGETALWLHGIAGFEPIPWLRLPRGCGNATRRTIRFRLGPVSGSVTWLQGLPVVDVEQALMDVAGSPGDGPVSVHHRLTRLIATADARRLTTLDRLDARLLSAGRFLGCNALRNAVADLRGELSHSDTERKARTLVAEVLRRYDLSLEPRPHEVFLGTRRVGEADLAVVAITLDIEIDGPHHWAPVQRDKDQARDRLVRRAGWEVERFPTELVDLSPKVLQARVDEAVRHRLGPVAAEHSSTPSAAGATEHV